MKGSNTYANFFWPIFKETWKTLVALCGAIFLYLEKRLKNVENERKRYICQLFLANFQGNLENVTGAMWRYVFFLCGFPGSSTFRNSPCPVLPKTEFFGVFFVSPVLLKTAFFGSFADSPILLKMALFGVFPIFPVPPISLKTVFFGVFLVSPVLLKMVFFSTFSVSPEIRNE